MTPTGSGLVARLIEACAIGLPTYSAFLILTRAYYAIGDTKTPALVNAAGVAVAGFSGAVLFLLFSTKWSVAGLALGHSLGFALAAVFLGRLFMTKIGKIGMAELRTSA